MASIFKDKRHLVGIILVLVGVALIIDNIRFIPDFIPYWVWTWPMLLIAIGSFSLLTNENNGPGIVLIGIGSVFLLWDILPNFWPGFFDFFIDDSSVFWYLVIIIVGASLIFRHRKRPDSKVPGKRHSRRPTFGKELDDPNEEGTSSSFGYSTSSDNDYLDEIAIFGGGEKIVTSDSFKGGKITTIFGGTDIILLRSRLAPGRHEIEVFCLFGGWTLRVPPNWTVKSEVVPIFGGVSDKRYIDGAVAVDSTRQLVIKGFVMFGGGEIK
jgi:hypothetical protein